LTNELYFTAGPNGGVNGLFGMISTTGATNGVPEPATLGLFIVGAALLIRSRQRHRYRGGVSLETRKPLPRRY